MLYRRLQMDQPLSYEQAELVNRLRMLMSQLAYLSRFYMVERTSGLGDPTVTLEELLKIPRELNELAATIPGFDVDFVPITLGYIGGLQGLIDAMIDGDDAGADESIRELYAISDQNAAYLASVSPYWDEERWRSIFYGFISAVVSEVIAIQSGDFDKSLDIFDTMMESAYERGDYYAQGFIPYLTEDQSRIPPAYFNMIQDLRRIETEWAYLTRFYMAAKIVGIGDAEYLAHLAQRLQEIPPRLAEKYKLILGNEDAEQLLNLLLIYAVRLEAIVNMIASGNDDEVEIIAQEAYRFSQQVAAYLPAINPYWDYAEGRDLFLRRVELLLQESYELKNKDYVAAMQTFQEFLEVSLAIGDYISKGLYQYTLIGSDQAPGNQVGTQPAGEPAAGSSGAQGPVGTPGHESVSGNGAAQVPPQQAARGRRRRR